ncbi:G5 domain-containing protein [Candidatus Saccharibacteria bacterium]|nr:G5 domain-containing protein [Candidatus Saccharibacteria bacterium]
MKLPRKPYQLLVCFNIFICGMLFFLLLAKNTQTTYADGEDATFSTGSHFVTFHDNGEALTIKTDAATVREALARANLAVQDTDLVEPNLDATVNSNNFHINIYRSRPVLIEDGITRKYTMAASYDSRTVVESAGFTVYDGDEIELANNVNFLESGIATTYKILRNGGRTITEEVPIAFTETTRPDYSLPTGESKLIQAGEDGLKVVKYEVNFKDGKEVSRKLISEEVVREPVARITATGAKKSIPPEQETCAGWAREAGVSESDLWVAMALIYRESGCRVNSTNVHSGAYGIPQALPGSKMASAGADWKTNPVTQIRWMIGYVNGRYGGWVQAWEFWQAHHWY